VNHGQHRAGKAAQGIFKLSPRGDIQMVDWLVR
jgi:hypothetical protein